MMKKLIFLLAVAAAIYGLDFVQEQGLTERGPSSNSPGLNRAVESAYENRQSDIQVRGQGTVLRVLPDDVEGSRHQRIILELETGQTLLIAHNIDLAPRVTELKKGDTVGFFGEYEWNSKGGVIHWTHHDPQGRHVGGWLEHNGRRYQ